MTTQLADFLKRLNTRKAASGNRVRTAFDYMRTLNEIEPNSSEFSKFFELRNNSQWDLALKQAQSIPVYSDENCGFITGQKLTDLGGVEQFGNVDSTKTLGSWLWQKDTEAKASPYIMEFDCVVTSKIKDRDGDILEPMGAELDMKMPLLYQHFPCQPIGTIRAKLLQDSEKIIARFAVVDSVLGRDVAFLIEANVLRISQGFQPYEFDFIEGKDGSGGGFHIKKYGILETSCVSIPSCVDAMIISHEKRKLHHPLMKKTAIKYAEDRTRYIVGGWETKEPQQPQAPTIHLTVNVNGTTVETSTDNTKKGGGMNWFKMSCLCGWYARFSKGTTPLTACPECKSIKLTKADEEEKKDDEKKEDEKKDDEKKEEEPEEPEKEEEKEPESEGGAGAGVMLGQIVEAIDAVAAIPDLPTEAVNRLQTVSGMLTGIEERLDSHAAAFNEAASNQDLAGMFGSMGDILTDVCNQLQRIIDEIGNVSTVEGLPDSAKSALGEINSDIAQVQSALAELNQAANNVDTGKDDIPPNDNGVNPDVVGAPPAADEMGQNSVAAEAKAVALIAGLADGEKMTGATAGLLLQMLQA